MNLRRVSITTQLLFIHSAGSQGSDEGSNFLSVYIQEELGSDYELRSSLMPDPEIPEYAAWNEQIGEELAQIDDAVVPIGYSLGGAVFLKHFSEMTIETLISGLFLVVPPLWDACSRIIIESVPVGGDVIASNLRMVTRRLETSGYARRWSFTTHPPMTDDVTWLRSKSVPSRETGYERIPASSGAGGGRVSICALAGGNILLRAQSKPTIVKRSTRKSPLHVRDRSRASLW